MAALRPLRPQQISRCATAQSRLTQRRWARVHDVRFLVTHEGSDRVTEKYKEKLEQKARRCGLIRLKFIVKCADEGIREGLRDVNELKAVYQEKIRSRRSAIDAEFKPASPHSAFPPPPPPPPLPTPSQPQSQSRGDLPVPNNPQTETSKPPNPLGVKTLSSFVDISKILELPQKEIEYLWRLRHANDPRSLCAVIPQTVYARIEATARRHPQFILPLPREEKGAEIHFLQWTFPTPTTSTVLFTHLAEFKLRGEYAQPHTTITHHFDIADQKGLVLLQGYVLNDRGITVDEGRFLLMCLQKFYGGEEGVVRRKLLEQFSQGDGEFKVEHLLEEAEKIL